MATKEKQVKRKKSGPTRVYSAALNKYAAFLCISIGDDPDVESTIYILYRNTITMHDGDEFRFGNTKPLKVMWVDDNPIDYFSNLCSLASLMDGDNLREYITDNGRDTQHTAMVNTMLRSRFYEFGDFTSYASRVIVRLRAEIEDYMLCSGTPWRRFKTFLKKIFCPKDYLPKSKTKSKK